MRMPVFALLAVAVLFTTSCSTPSGQTSSQTATNFINKQKVVVMTKETYPKKKPDQVSLYTSDKPLHTAYRVIGVATVSKHNLLGMQRQDGTINDMMKKIAASMGGDAVINISNNPDNIQANIIAFQKILI